MKLSGIIFLFLAILSINGLAQQTVAQRQPASEKAIPKAVVSVFAEQYPKARVMGWYATHITYWMNDYSSNWYTGWYGQRNVVVYSFEKPTYFEVEFTLLPGEVSRAIYNSYGYWYETRTQIKGLTLDIMNALKVSKYHDWKLSPVMEKLESPMWPVEIYRFNMTKGLKSKILRMDGKGNLVQVKEVR